MRPEPVEIILGLGLFVLALCHQSSLQAGHVMPEIEARLQQAIEDGEVLSAHLALLREGQVETFAFGTLDPEDATAPDGESAYQIGSITKVFTNLLLAEMVAAGQVRYETTIQDILGDEVEFANPAVGQITLIQLATHTSGLPRMPLNFMPPDLRDPYAAYGEAQLLAALARTRAGQVLGNHSAYSNFGSGLLGYLLGRVHGDGYEAALESLVLTPLGLDHTGMQPRTPMAQAWAEGAVTVPWTFDALAGCGALWSTSSDLIALIQSWLGARPHELRQDFNDGKAMITHFAPGLAVTPVWHVAETDKGPVYWHNGGTFGNSSFLGFRPASGEALALLIAGELDLTGEALAWFGFSSAPAEEVQVDRSVEGRYQLTPAIVIRIFSGTDGLMAQLTGQAAAPVHAVDQDWYAFDIADASLHFVREHGQVTAVQLIQNALTQTAPRIADEAVDNASTRTAIDLDPETLADYLGEYILAPGVSFVIRERNGSLEARLTGQTFLAIAPRAEDVFFYQDVDAELHFERDETGRVVALVLHQGGLRQRAERVR